MIDDPLTQLLVEITGTSWSLTTRYNIAPTEMVPVLTWSNESGWHLPMMRWWLVPHWASEPSTRYSMFNAKSETLASSRAYSTPFRRQRCIIPASGYYEWKKEGSLKVPYYIEPETDPGFAFAGLWDRWQKDDSVIESCTIITAAAPTSMQQVHHRIPVHLTAQESRNWVNNETSSDRLKDILRPEIRTGIRVTPVSTIVNNARNKDDRCVEPLGQATIIPH